MFYNTMSLIEQLEQKKQLINKVWREKGMVALDLTIAIPWIYATLMNLRNYDYLTFSFIRI